MLVDGDGGNYELEEPDISPQERVQELVNIQDESFDRVQNDMNAEEDHYEPMFDEEECMRFVSPLPDGTRAKDVDGAWWIARDDSWWPFSKK